MANSLLMVFFNVLAKRSSCFSEPQHKNNITCDKKIHKTPQILVCVIVFFGIFLDVFA